jgi:GNAT superfamily N-acetyltransferase
MSNRVVAPFRSEDYAFVPATTVEESRLIEFAAAVWPGRSPGDHVLSSWWRRAEPGYAVAAVHRATGAMAGICGGRACEWAIAGERLPAVAICDWYVAPAHAGRGLGKRLVQHFETPARFLYAFSISDAAIANFKKLGWCGPYRSSLMALPVPRLVGLVMSLRRDRSGLAFEHHMAAAGEPLGTLGDDLDRIESGRTPHGSAHMRRGASDWSWRLSACSERRYSFCIARRAGAPVGYVVGRPMTQPVVRLPAAIITDLAARDEDEEVLQALAAKAVEMAGELRVAVAVTATTTAAHRRALAKAGFLSSNLPVLGRALERRAPQFMWLPRGPAASLTADDMAMTFADAAVDLDL